MTTAITRKYQWDKGKAENYYNMLMRTPCSRAEGKSVNDLSDELAQVIRSTAGKLGMTKESKTREQIN